MFKNKKQRLKIVATGVMALSIALGGAVLTTHVYAAEAKTKTQTNDPEFKEHRGGQGKAHRGQAFGISKFESELLAYLKLDQAALKEKLKTQTLAEVAKAQGISREDFKAKLVAWIEETHKSMPKPPVQDGKAPKVFNASAIADRILDAKHPLAHKGPQGHHGRMIHFQSVAKLLGITEAQLRKELVPGTTLAKIAAAHNKTAQQVIDLLTKEAVAKLDAKLASGKITQEKYNTLKPKLVERITRQVNEGVPNKPKNGHHPQENVPSGNGQGA